MTILDELTKKQQPKEFSEDAMGILAETVNRLISKQKQITDAEEALKRLKTEERGINQGEIPQMMDNLGFSVITLKDGRILSVKEAVQCSIPSTEKMNAYNWMDKNNHGSLIKTALMVKFARGEAKMVLKAENALKKLGIEVTISESVHAGTLKAWAREELSLGHSLPADLFKIHVVKITTVK